MYILLLLLVVRIRVLSHITVTDIYELQLICANFLLKDTFQSPTVPSRVSGGSVIDTIIRAFFVLLSWRDINWRQGKFIIGYSFFNQSLNILKAARTWISVLITLSSERASPLLASGSLLQMLPQQLCYCEGSGGCHEICARDQWY